MEGLDLFKTVAVAMLILANAFFVAAEFTLVSIRDTRVQQLLVEGVPGARAVRRLRDNLDDLLPAVQLGVTLCSLALGWMGEPLAAGMLMGWLGGLPHARVFARVAAAVTGFALIAYFEVVVGELVPKSLALRRAEALAVAVAPPMLAFIAVTRPAVRLLRSSAAAVLRGFGVPMTERAAVHSAEELQLITSAAARMGLLPPFQEKLVHRALEIDDVTVREIMTPRQNIFSLPSNMPIEEASARAIARQHSRIPVYDEARGPEHIVGVAYARDLARLMHFRVAPLAAKPPVSRPPIPNPSVPYSPVPSSPVPSSPVEVRLRQIMRDVLVVPETKPVLDLIREFQERRRQMAIAVDEYGSVVGLVTAEDAIEQLTGELEDEFDNPARSILTAEDGVLLMDGGVNLRDLETQMQWSLPREGGVETLAGFLLVQLGHIPRPGEFADFEERRLTVVEMDGRRITRVRVEPVGGRESTANLPHS
ncbi:MAG: hemolysin family protein [Terracidiphilus sp.]